jgi:hypothetical protein
MMSYVIGGACLKLGVARCWGVELERERRR